MKACGCGSVPNPEILQDALPVDGDTVAVQRIVDPMVKVTVPVGVSPLGEAGDTCAKRTTMPLLSVPADVFALADFCMNCAQPVITV